MVIRTPTRSTTTEGYMDGNDNASPRTVLRSRRPQNTPRNFMHENRETSEMSVIEADCRTAGEGQGRTARMHVSEESDSGVIPMNHSKKDGGRRPRPFLPHARLRGGGQRFNSH